MFDPDRMVAADFAFMAKQTQRFQINLGLGALIGGAGVYAASQKQRNRGTWRGDAYVRGPKGIESFC